MGLVRLQREKKEGVEVTVVKNAVGSEREEVKFGAFETTGPLAATLTDCSIRNRHTTCMNLQLQHSLLLPLTTVLTIHLFLAAEVCKEDPLIIQNGVCAVVCSESKTW